MTLIEALASGTPVVAMRNGGPESIVSEPEFGFLANDSEDGLVDALRRAAASVGTFDSEQIRRMASERYSEPAVIGQLERVYREVLAQAAKKSDVQ